MTRYTLSTLGAIVVAVAVLSYFLPRHLPVRPCVAADSANANVCEERCKAGDADACDQTGWWYGAWRGGAVPIPPRDREKGRVYWKRACGLGRMESCGRGLP